MVYVRLFGAVNGRLLDKQQQKVIQSHELALGAYSKLNSCVDQLYTISTDLHLRYSLRLN